MISSWPAPDELARRVAARLFTPDPAAVGNGRLAVAAGDRFVEHPDPQRRPFPARAIESLEPAATSLPSWLAVHGAMEQARELVRGLEDRMAPWGMAAPRPISWHLFWGPAPPVRLYGDMRLPEDSLEDALADAEVDVLGLAADDWPLPHDWTRTALCSLYGWQVASGLGLVVPSGHWPPRALIGVEFADLPNPFEPIVELYCLGFVPSAWESMDRWNLFVRGRVDR